MIYAIFETSIGSLVSKLANEEDLEDMALAIEISDIDFPVPELEYVIATVIE